MVTASKTVLAVLEDLFFTVKIADAAKRAGAVTIFVKTAGAALERLRDFPAVVVVDLNCGSIDPIDFVKQIKAGEYRGIPVIGFVSHVQTELRQKAQDAGYDMVVARSAFSGNLPDILRRHIA
jgi:CheY-like chemotaxis protein